MPNDNSRNRNTDIGPDTTINGHAAAGFCEKCWGEAYGRAMSTSDKSQYEHYLDILREVGTICVLADFADGALSEPSPPSIPRP